ncbi:hypothetical protein MNBD_GAMMA13-1040 [hydrothermal vent metagenome]|uniref:Uncharacterized protein n=1 Tax=hydrothermal vent metagenome TaxID=652676 RepID=A0A3B0YH09_9ZZZZ
MEAPSFWESILVGGLAILLIFWFRPGIKAMFKERREASQSEWMGILIPIGLVAVFVTLLIALT